MTPGHKAFRSQLTANELGGLRFAGVSGPPYNPDQPEPTPSDNKGSGDLGSVSSHKDPTPIRDAGCPWEWPSTDATPRDITLEGLPPPPPCLAGAYRASKHEVTGFTPNFLMLGREVRLAGDLPVPEDTFCNKAEYVDKLRERLHTAHAITRKHLGRYAQRQTDRYDANAPTHTYMPGDLAWYRNELKKENTCPTLQASYIGPVLVLENYNDIDFLMQKERNGKPVVVHHDKMKPYYGTKKLSWKHAAVRKHK